jgi:hypothetical protein
LLRELMNESPWGNQPWADGQHHGAPWAIDLAARMLASMSYPLISDHLRDREPARLHERDAAEFREQDEGELLADAFRETQIERTALPHIPPAYVQRTYENGRVQIHVDLAGAVKFSSRPGNRAEFGKADAELELVALSVLFTVLVDEVYGELASSASIELVEFDNYDEYGEGVLDSAKSKWSREFDRASLQQFIREAGK